MRKNLEYGLFCRNEGIKHVFIYFREDSALITDFSKDEAAYRKLQMLKSRIMYDFGKCVHFYSKDNISTGEFTQTVVQDILRDLEAEWNASVRLSEYDREYNVHHLAMVEKAKYFSAYEEFADEVIKNIRNQSYSNYALIGESGSGKSTMFAHLMCSFEQNGWDIVPILSGYTAKSTDREEIAKTIICFLENKLGMEHMADMKTHISVIELKNHLTYLYKQYGETNNSMIIGIDAVEQLSLEKDNFWFLPDEETTNIKVVITTWNRSIIVSNQFSVLKMPILNIDVQKKMITGILRVNGKQLSNTVRDEIIKLNSSKNPLMLYLIVNRLCLMDQSDYDTIRNMGGGMDHITSQQMYIIQDLPNTPNELSVDILKFMAKTLKVPSCFLAMKLLATSRFGLREDDLYSIINSMSEMLLPLSFVQYRNCIQDLFLTRSDGRIDFIHQCFRDALHDTDTKEYNTLIAKHMLTLDEKDLLRTEEVFYHLIQAKMDEELVFEISQLSYHFKPKAAKELYWEIRSNPLFVKELLNRIGENDTLADDVVEFVMFVLYNVMDMYIENLESNSEIPTAIEFVESIAKWLEKVLSFTSNKDILLKSKYASIWANIAVGRLYGEYRTEKDNTTSFSYLEKALDFSQELAISNPSSFALSEVGVAYYETGRVLVKSGENRNRKQGYIMFREALKLHKQSVVMKGGIGSVADLKNILLCTMRLSEGLTHDRYEKNVLKAIDYLEDSISLVEKTALEKDLPYEIQIELANAYHTLGNAYRNLTKTDAVSIAIEKYKKALAIFKEWSMKSEYLSLINHMANSYVAITRAYRLLGDKDSRLNACYYAKKAVEYTKTVFSHRKLFDNLDNYGLAIGEYAELLSEMSEEPYLSEGRDIVSEALSILQGDEYSRIYGDVSNRNKLLLFDGVLKGVACFVVRTNNLQGIKDTLTIIEQSKNIVSVESIMGDSYDSETAYALKSIYSSAANLCLVLRSQTNQELGFHYSQMTLAICKRIVQMEQPSYLTRRSLEVSLLNVGVMIVSDSKKKNEEALDYLCEGLSIAKDLDDEYGTPETKWDHSYALLKNVEALLGIDSADFSLAKEYAEKAVIIRRELAVIQDTIDKKVNLINAVNILAQVSLKGDDLLSAKSIAWYAISLSEDLMLESDNDDTQHLLAVQYRLYANCLLKLGEKEEASKYFDRANRHYSDIANETNTLENHLQQLSHIVSMVKSYSESGNVDETVKWFNEAVSITKQYCESESNMNSKLAAVDVYMAAEPFLTDMIRRVDNSQAIVALLIEIYEESIAVYEEQLQLIVSEADIQESVKCISNLSALYIGLARVYWKSDQNAEARVYYDKCINVGNAFNLEGVDNQRLYTIISNLYRSHAEIGYSFAEEDDYVRAYGSFSKAVEIANQKMALFSDQQQKIEIYDDSQEYSYNAAIAAIRVGDLERALFYCETAKSYISLLKYYGYDNYSNQEAAIDKMFMLLSLMPKPRNENRVEKELQDLYDTAETCEKGPHKIELLKKFCEQEQKIPDEQKSAKILIYSYNALQLIAGEYFNPDNIDELMKAKKYMLMAVSRELEVMELPAAQSRKMEIQSDLQEDISWGMKICTLLGDLDGMLEFILIAQKAGLDKK